VVRVLHLRLTTESQRTRRGHREKLKPEYCCLARYLARNA
jgi:hypothetical protein